MKVSIVFTEDENGKIVNEVIGDPPIPEKFDDKKAIHILAEYINEHVPVFKKNLLSFVNEVIAKKKQEEIFNAQGYQDAP